MKVQNVVTQSSGLYEAEVIRRRGPWRSLEDVEYATLEWIEWYNNRRLFGAIGNIPPTEFEERHYQEPAKVVGLN